MKKYTAVLIILTFICILFSCRKFVQIPGPKNQIVTSQVFADSADATSAVLGLYINSMNSYYGLNSGAMSIFPGLSADELNITANNTDYQQFYNENVLTSNNTNNSFWSAAYTFIYTANACVEGITASTGIATTTKNQLIAEARFFRAYEYFYLINLYGDVPLVLSTDYTQNDHLARTGSDKVYQQIIQDLQFAEVNLPAYNGTTTRPVSLAATALLAKVYLYTKTYNLAVTEATKVISSGNFVLEQDLNNVFLNTSRETIWQMATVTQGRATFEGYVFIPSSGTAVPNYPLTSVLYNDFEAGDNRKSNWVGTDTVNDIAYPYPYKYKQSLTTGSVNEYEVVLRLADVYLIRSEADYNTGNYSDAIADLNLIRNRAGLPYFSAADPMQIFQAIQQERRVELFCEWGNRWLDLKRWNLANSVLSLIKTNWQSTDQFYPVPSEQINSNPVLVQNLGY